MVRWLTKRRVWISRGWVGVRTGRFYWVARDTSKHKPMFSERYGYVPFHRFVKIGHWELGWK